MDETGFMQDSQNGTVYIRINIPELKLQKCLQFHLDDSVWQAKQRTLASFAKDLRDGINYGLYCPPLNGRAGKFLDEERLLREYPLQGPIGFLEFKYKRRVYKVMQINPRRLKQLHTKANLKQFLECVKNSNLDKINKFTAKGLDPNYHDMENGETPLCLAVGLGDPKCKDVIISLVSGGAHLDFRNKHGQTSLHKAAILGNIAAINTLLDLGASPNYKDSKGLTPLYFSVSCDTSPLCTELLLKEHSILGVRDEQGWFEIHQASRYGRVQHLENLIFFGAEMDVQNASGNTALHVCAVENKESCARVLLFRGASKEVLNYNNHSPYQLAIIANNMELAEIIQHHRNEDVVPHQELPKYSERRKFSSVTPSFRALIRSRSDPRIDISLEDRFNASRPINRSNVSDSGYNMSRGYNSDSPRSLSISSTSSGPAHFLRHRQSDVQMSHLLPPTRSFSVPSFDQVFVCVSSYMPRHGSELCLQTGDIVQVLGIGEHGFWEGRMNEREGWFPSDHVQGIKMRRRGSWSDVGDQSITMNRNTLAALVHNDSEYSPRTVVLQKGPDGFGFVLRGARSHQARSGSLDFHPTSEFPALQYLDSVETGSMSDRAGLKSGDFILEINGENVIRASHDRVVQLIKSSGDTIAMKLVTVRPTDKPPEWFIHQDGSMTLPHRKKQAPEPPRRNPATSLSYSKGKSKSFAEGLAEIERLDETLADYDSSSVSRVSMSSAEHAPEMKTASIRQHHSTKRLSCIELGSGPSNTHNDNVSSGSSKPTIYMSPSELRIQKHHPKKKMAPTPMEKSKSTSNLADSDYASPIMQKGTGVVGYPSYVGSRKYSGGDSYHTVVNVGGSTDHGQHVYAVPVNGYANVPPGYSATLRRPAHSTNRDALVKSISIGGNHVLPSRPKSSPPAPPPDVVKINTNRQSVYADTGEIQPKKEESPYESSFRPGTVAKLTNQPLVTTASLEQAKLRSHQRNASAASSQSDDSRRSGDSRHSADRPSVSFAEDKVFENASSYVQRHPNATLLVTADVHKKRESFEPVPDYDDDSDDIDVMVTGRGHRKQSQGSNSSNISVGSQNKVHVMNKILPTQNRSSVQVNSEPSSKPAVTIISVGSDQRAPAMTLKTDIPKHRPQPPTSSGSESKQQGSTYHGVSHMTPTSTSESAMSIPPRPAEPAPSPPERSYNAFNDQIRLAAEKRQQQEPSVIYPSRPAPPPPALAAPPPPPPPPSAGPAPPTPVPSATQISSETQQRRPGAPAFSVQEIQAAAAERIARMEVRGPIEQQIPVSKPKNDTQVAILAAVAKRRNMLEQKTDTDVVDQIELRLNKTKKLQAAKFFTTESINQSRGAMSETKDDESKMSTNKESVTNNSHNNRKSSTEVHLDSSPAETKKQTTSTINTQSLAKSPPKLNVVVSTPSAKASEVSPTPKQIEVVSKQTEKVSSPKPSDTPNVTISKQSDFLALAEKARQEYLQKRASTSTLPRKAEAKASEQTPTSQTASKPVTVPASSSQKIFSSSMIPKNNQTTTINVVSSSTEQKQKSVDPDNGNVAIKALKDVDNDKETISSIQDKIAGFEKQKANLNGTVGNARSYQVKGVTIDHSQTDTLTRKDKAKAYAMQNGTDSFVFDGELPPPMVSPPPPLGFGDTSRDYNKRPPTSSDLVHIEIIPPPASFANMDNNNDDTNSSGEQYHPAFSHDDSVSLVSSLSTLSTLSSEHGEAGEKLSHRAGQGYDEIVAPPPPGFDDTAHVSNSYYEEINNDGFIPPPPEFGGNEKQNSLYVKSNKPFNSKTLDSWLCIDVLDWLVSLNMSQYKESFAQHCIDGKKLQMLVRNDFIELGVTQVGHRMNMERAIQKASLSKTHL